MINATIEGYTFDELSDDARARVFETWKAGNVLEVEFEMESEDLYRALAGVRVLTHTDHAGAAYFDDYSGAIDFLRPCSFDRALGACLSLPEYGTTGDCYGYDLAAAYNKHADSLEAIKDAFEAVSAAFDNYDGGDGEITSWLSLSVDNLTEAFSTAFEKALADVAAAYNKDLEDLYRYYIDREGARELWEGFWRSEYTAGRVFTADGADITSVFDLAREAASNDH